MSWNSFDRPQRTSKLEQRLKLVQPPAPKLATRDDPNTDDKPTTWKERNYKTEDLSKYMM